MNPLLATAEAVPGSALRVRMPAPAPAPAVRRRPDADRLLVELHEQHEAELLRFCQWMLKDSEQAADALQDTWTRAIVALRDDGIRVVAHRPWLFTVARNVCLDRLRDRKRESVHELDESAAGDTPGADEVLAVRQEADAALALVGALPERQRAALLMRELAGMSVPDIAQALGVPVERAHWAIADARRALNEARSGTSLACEEVRARVDAGRRGRAVRLHVSGCTPCQAHDRRCRARRILAPALLPILWLKRAVAAPSLAPAAAATVVALSTPFAAPDRVEDRAGARDRGATAVVRERTAAPAASLPAPGQNARPVAAARPARPARARGRVTPPAARSAPAADASPPAATAASPQDSLSSPVADVAPDAVRTVSAQLAPVAETARSVVGGVQGSVARVVAPAPVVAETVDAAAALLP